MNNPKIALTWYGRCCFLIEINKTKILLDPHDTFDKIDMGQVKSDFTLISSTWHDHGHIGASPDSIIFSEPGTYKLDNGIIITGIKTAENRGTRNIIFNIRWGQYSITNFADLGDKSFYKKLTASEKRILAKTNIALSRPNIVLGTKLTSIDLALQACDPKILIPHHYYPTIFLKRLKGNLKKNATNKHKEFEAIFRNIPRELRSINSYKKTLTLNNGKKQYLLLFQDIHPQVKQR